MLLKRLIDASAVSGQEKEVRDMIRDELKDHVDKIETDKLGNLIVYKKGRKEGNKVLISAAMDEIGGIVTKINSDGTVKFTKAGTYDDRILVSKIVKIGDKGVNGVIGAKPIHLQKPDERKKSLTIDQLYADIGVSSKEEALKHVKIGDYISIVSETKDLNDSTIKGKALDSRIPCSILIDFLKEEQEYSVYAAFTVMDKVRIFGARCAGFSVCPDYTIALDGTEAELGKGAVINVKELRAVFDREMVSSLIELSESKGIKYQIVTDEKSITGADLYQIAAEGIKVAKISVPCKYLNTPVNIAKYDDIDSVKELLKSFVTELGGINDVQ